MYKHHIINSLSRNSWRFVSNLLKRNIYKSSALPVWSFVCHTVSFRKPFDADCFSCRKFCPSYINFVFIIRLVLPREERSFLYTTNKLSKWWRRRLTSCGSYVKRWRLVWKGWSQKQNNTPLTENLDKLIKQCKSVSIRKPIYELSSYTVKMQSLCVAYLIKLIKCKPTP